MFDSPPRQRSTVRFSPTTSPQSCVDESLAMTPSSSVIEEDESRSLQSSLMEDVAGDIVGDDDEVAILCELVGARNLRVRDEDQWRGVDSNSLRPYCVVKYDGKRIHRTKASVDQGCNPIWVPSTNSLFVLRTTPREMSRCIMNISIYSKQESTLPVSLLQSPTIFFGQINMDPTAILSHCDEDRFEVTIEDEIGEETSNLGKLALRFRIATPSDLKLARIFNETAKKSYDESERELVDIVLDSAIPPTGKTSNIFKSIASRKVAPLVTEKDETQLAQSSFVNALSNVFATRTATDRVTGAKKVRIKPFPDPDRREETQFLTPHDLKVETRLPSMNWVEAGSGSLGKIYVEILSCHDLPNLDTGGEAIGNFTDTFCTLVYEDSCAMTDVIDDELSPHWLPWTQRAFCFNMIHPASILYLAVFDFDFGIGQHEPIGRVAVNVCNLQRDTIHTLKYNLYPSSNVTARTANGSIVIRLRIECYNAREALLAAWKPRPKMHVNATKEKSFRVIRYTCFGEYDNEEKFDLTVARSYVNEIFEYKAAVGYALGDAFRSLVFWHGQVEIFSVMLPIHSLVFFMMATRFVERPQLIVPYTLLGVSWAMLANLTKRRQHPSPWNSCPSFLQYLHILRTGESSIPVKSIKEYEGAESAKEYELAWKKRLEEDRKIAEKRAALLQEINNIGDDNIHTQVSQGAIPLDLLLRLARYQGIIGRLCKRLRFAKIILTWEESVVSFWVTATSLALGLVSLLLPWGFILTWTGRILVYGLFGPHMKLVDLFLRANQKKNSALKDLMKNFDIQSNLARLRREEALKIKDIKEIAFGKYSVQVPSFNLSRHHDRPLPESSSRVCRKTPKPKVRSSRRMSVANLREDDPWIPGQQLYGSMIPRPQYDEAIHKEEAEYGEKVLQLFKDRVRHIKEADGLSDFERKQLRKLGCRSSLQPMHFGYEVVPLIRDEIYDCEETDTESENNLIFENKKEPSVRFAVTLTSDKQAFVDKKDERDVLLESDGDTTYCISEEYGSEEGLEVIGLGRYSTMAEASESFEEDLFVTESRDSLMKDERLSQVFTSNYKIQVAFYRPLEGVDKTKCKED